MLKNKTFVKWGIFLFVLVFVFILAFKVDGNQGGICLRRSYEVFKQNFMSKDGRILDYERDSVTTSEGQSYMMLRSLIMNDKKTFDLVWKWMKNNLQRKDYLFAWLWGKNPSNEYKILDYNSASDADVDIAFGLLLAYEKWGEFKYLEEARFIINSIWNNEVKQVGTYLVLMPGAKQTSEVPIQINPSYFSPYAFRSFQKYDELHDWNMLVDSSYCYLNANMAKTSTGLPSNWALLENGEIVLENSERSDFSYDAIRVFARIYLDYVRTGEKRALPILEKTKFFVEKWKSEKEFYVNYRANGKLRDKDKFIGSMAILIPVISLYDKETAEDMYKNAVDPSFQDEKYWDGTYDYYGKNLSWFAYYVYFQKTSECIVKKPVVGQ